MSQKSAAESMSFLLMNSGKTDKIRNSLMPKGVKIKNGFIAIPAEERLINVAQYAKVMRYHDKVLFTASDGEIQEDISCDSVEQATVLMEAIMKSLTGATHDVERILELEREPEM